LNIPEYLKKLDCEGWPRVKNQNNQIVVFGRKGSGKTVKAAEYIAWADRPVVIVDTVGEFIGDYRHPGTGDVIFHALPVKPEHVPKALKEIFELMDLEAPAFPAQYVLSVQVRGERGDLKGEARLRAFDDLCYQVYEVGNLIFVVDELDQWCGPASLPGGLRNIINYGRHSQVDFLGLSRRPARVHRDVTANADTWHVFQTVEKRDLDYIRDLVPPHRAAEVDKLPALGVGECLKFSVHDRAESAEKSELEFPGKAGPGGQLGPVDLTGPEEKEGGG